MAFAVSAAWAGSPHFVGSVEFTFDSADNTITATGKEAGLGGESQVHIVLSATASCINPGDRHPRAENKQDLSAEGDFPVQNGKADFELSVTPSFQPDCTPPMSVIFTNVKVTDETNGITQSFSGPF